MVRVRPENFKGIKGKSGRKNNGDENKILKLKGLAVDWATEEMEKPDSPHKKDIVLKILGNIIPKEIGDLSGEFKITWEK